MQVGSLQHYPVRGEFSVTLVVIRRADGMSDNSPNILGARARGGAVHSMTSENRRCWLPVKSASDCMDWRARGFLRIDLLEMRR
jgi:hypothetical protein